MLHTILCTVFLHCFSLFTYFFIFIYNFYFMSGNSVCSDIFKVLVIWEENQIRKLLTTRVTYCFNSKMTFPHRVVLCNLKTHQLIWKWWQVVVKAMHPIAFTTCWTPTTLLLLGFPSYYHLDHRLCLQTLNGLLGILNQQVNLTSLVLTWCYQFNFSSGLQIVDWKNIG